MSTETYSGLVLILGCHGRQELIGDYEFISCSSTENEIVHLDDIINNRDIILNYLEKITKIFDKQKIFGHNVISNALYFLYEHGAISKEFYKYIVNYFGTHKRCGFYLKVDTC